MASASDFVASVLTDVPPTGREEQGTSRIPQALFDPIVRSHDVDGALIISKQATPFECPEYGFVYTMLGGLHTNGPERKQMVSTPKRSHPGKSSAGGSTSGKKKNKKKAGTPASGSKRVSVSIDHDAVDAVVSEWEAMTSDKERLKYVCKSTAALVAEVRQHSTDRMSLLSRLCALLFSIESSRDARLVKRCTFVTLSLRLLLGMVLPDGCASKEAWLLKHLFWYFGEDLMVEMEAHVHHAVLSPQTPAKQSLWTLCAPVLRKFRKSRLPTILQSISALNRVHKVSKETLDAWSTSCENVQSPLGLVDDIQSDELSSLSPLESWIYRTVGDQLTLCCVELHNIGRVDLARSVLLVLAVMHDAVVPDVHRAGIVLHRLLQSWLTQLAVDRAHAGLCSMIDTSGAMVERILEARNHGIEAPEVEPYGEKISVRTLMLLLRALFAPQSKHRCLAAVLQGLRMPPTPSLDDLVGRAISAAVHQNLREVRAGGRLYALADLMYPEDERLKGLFELIATRLEKRR